MCDPYGIQLSHIFEIPNISNESLVFQSKYLAFRSKTLDFEMLGILSEMPSTSKKV